MSDSDEKKSKRSSEKVLCQVCNKQIAKKNIKEHNQCKTHLKNAKLVSESVSLQEQEEPATCEPTLQGLSKKMLDLEKYMMIIIQLLDEQDEDDDAIPE